MNAPKAESQYQRPRMQLDRKHHNNHVLQGQFPASKKKF
jgi:hypothetical protein